MKILADLLGLFVPRETAESDAGGGEEAPADPQPQGGSDPEGKPNWLPDKFWDQDVGIRAQPLAEAYSSLEQKMREAFFAEGRDAARYELARQQMLAAAS